MSTSDFDAVLADYNARAAEESSLMRSAPVQDLLTQRDRFLLHVGEDVARFLHSLIVARRCQRILEIGTSYGYSTLFLAEAARMTAGRLVTLELSEKKLAYARTQLGRAGLADRVEWLQGDALEILQRIDGPFDFVLLDLWKELYVPCFERFLPKLSDNAIVAADNMLEPRGARADARAYRSAVRAVPFMQSVLVPIGQGIEVSCVWRADPA